MEAKRYRIDLFVYPRGRKKGEAFGVNFKQGYRQTFYRHCTLEEAKQWVDEVHNVGLVWIHTWNIVDCNE